MSTRSNILLKSANATDDWDDSLWFYRHYDGYPEGAMPLIAKFVKLVNDRKIRANPSQSGGWLIWLGMQEYDVAAPQDGNDLNISDWKVGAIEPTSAQHGDIDYRYTITLHEGWRENEFTRAEVVCEEVIRWEDDPEADYGYRTLDPPKYKVVDVSEYLQPKEPQVVQEAIDQLQARAEDGEEGAS